ncbi:hypothetical protein GCM10010220_46620 [Streptomyces parvulus]|nr:hypothetical protein GCM10010220_46620 [Streptomyces parvulus]
MLPDLLEAFLRDAAPTRHVLQERDHVVRALRAAEREEEQGVVRTDIEHVWHVSILPPGTDSGATAGADRVFRLLRGGVSGRSGE